jgi:hypothetical protein
VKVAKLIGAQLDYWVARAEGYGPSEDEAFIHIDGRCRIAYHEGDDPDSLYQPSTNWMWGGRIIEREKISTWRHDDTYGDDFPRDVWFAAVGGVHGWDDGSVVGSVEMTGETPLVAAMRAYVASKFGDEVEDASQPAGD